VFEAFLWFCTAVPFGSFLGEETAIDRHLRMAREGSPIVRPQAARRLLKHGEEAAARLLVECGENPAQMARLGPEIVAILGAFDDEALRRELWGALQDARFPWRPAAAQSLARSALAGEGTRFLALTEDPLAAVREGAIGGLRELDARESSRKRLHTLLEDDSDRVRRASAVLLDEWGETACLTYLLEELKRDDRFFSLETGKRARYAAFKVLRARLGMDGGFQPAKSPGDPANQQAWQQLREQLEGMLDGPLPPLPRVAQAAPPTAGDVLGLEIRSCRHGEFFLRWNLDDVLWVGLGNAERVPLVAGTVAKLLQAYEQARQPLQELPAISTSGCDLEKYYWQPSSEDRAQVYRLAKSPEPAAALRPKELISWLRQLMASVPVATPEGRPLHDPIAAALQAVGGDI
jgi:hypothetical protein